MKLAEQVTFGGSGLNRAAHLRADSRALEAMLDHPDASAVVLWRGKPLVLKEGGLELVPVRHPVLKAGYDKVFEAPVFLGLDESDAPVFVSDVSGWEPDQVDTAALGLFLDPSEQNHPDLPDDSVFVELRRLMTRLNPRDAELAATAKALVGWHQSHGFCARCGAPSQIVQAGWQRSCAACGAHHFPRTDPVVIMLITHGNSVLMGRSPGWPEGMYSLLAGFGGPGGAVEAAVRREVFEEASEAISVNMKTLCFDAEESLLNLTENTQPALLTVSIATLRALNSIRPMEIMVGAGHSVGEYAALVASKTISSIFSRETDTDGAVGAGGTAATTLSTMVSISRAQLPLFPRTDIVNTAPCPAK